MAKAKILDDKIVIASEVLTDANIEKVKILAPSALQLFDEKDETKLLFEVTNGEYNSFTSYGAVFNEGKTLGTISEDVMSLDKDAKENKIKNILTSVLTRINAVEEQVDSYLENAIDLSEDIEFLD